MWRGGRERIPVVGEEGEIKETRPAGSQCVYCCFWRRMFCYRILAFLIVIITFTDCLPPGNITHNTRRVFRFPQNASTAVRRLPPGRVLVLSPIFFQEYLIPRMVRPSIPRVVRPNVPQVVRANTPQAVRTKFPQIVRTKFSQADKSETPQDMKPEASQVVKLDSEEKLPEVVRISGHSRLLQSAQPDQLVSASSSSAFRTPSGGWARDKNTTSRIGVGEELFVFPDDDPPKIPAIINRNKNKPVKYQAPPCADGSTFCEEVDGYPENILENILENDLDQFKELQGIDELRSPPITQRIDINATNEQPLCPSIEDVVFPKNGKNKDDKYMFILNTNSFKQGVRIEKCLKTSDEPEQSCFFNDSFPNGYKTVCKQKHIYRRMVAVGEDGKPFTDTFSLPSCCSCTVVAVGATFRQGMIRKTLRTNTTPPKN